MPPKQRRPQARSAPPGGPIRDVVEESEREIIDLAVQNKFLEFQIEAKESRAYEVAVSKAITAQLIAAEKSAGRDAAKLRAVHAQRDRAALLSRRLDELEEERRMLTERPESRAALEAWLRVSAGEARCEELRELAMRRPAETAAEADEQMRTLELEALAYEAEEARWKAVAQLGTASETENWLAMKEDVNELMDNIEAMRLNVAKLELYNEEREKSSKAALQTARDRASARMAPLRKEVAALEAEKQELQEEAEAAEADRKAKAPPEDPEAVKRKEEAAKLNEEIKILKGEIIQGKEEQRVRREKEAAERRRGGKPSPRAAAAVEPTPAAAAPAKAPAPSPAAAQPLQETQPVKAAAAPAANAPAPAAKPSIHKPNLLAGRRAVPDPSQRKLGAEQKGRLDELKAKYGDGVAKKLAASAKPA